MIIFGEGSQLSWELSNKYSNTDQTKYSRLNWNWFLVTCNVHIRGTKFEKFLGELTYRIIHFNMQ